MAKTQKFCFFEGLKGCVSEEYTWFVRGSQGWVNGVRVKKEVLWRGEAGRIHGRHATVRQEGHLMSRILGVRLEAGIKYQLWRKIIFSCGVQCKFLCVWWFGFRKMWGFWFMYSVQGFPSEIYRARRKPRPFHMRLADKHLFCRCLIHVAVVEC